MGTSSHIGGRPPHHPSPTDRRVVELMAAKGIPQAQICAVLDISQKTLRKHYGAELRRGASKLEAALIMHLHRIACGRDGTALRAVKFILKARFGWSEYAPPPPG
jgi:DNA-binding CsgD family transcriptional regulator